jgi:MioC protein
MQIVMDCYRILVGTMTGTAELAAEEMMRVLVAAGAAVEILRMDEVGLEVFTPPVRVVICCSTFGAGDVPDNAFPLLDALEQQRPDLSAASYSVFGLGDRIYRETFCGGGKTFDALLASLGARRFAAPLFHDASDGTRAEEVAVAWASAFEASSSATSADRSTAAADGATG